MGKLVDESTNRESAERRSYGVVEAADCMSRGMPHVSVCICTYKRPRSLGRLLKELTRESHCDGFTYSVVVVDNDASMSGRVTVEEWRSRSRVDVQYHCEPRQNIALARNKAVLSGTGDYLAFIDDDEFPGEGWLARLLEAREMYQADGVLGPVLPCYDCDPPRWILKGRFHERKQHKTGTVLDVSDTRTGNVLLRRAIFSGAGSMFREEFGRGGEDTDFFRRMIGRGLRFVWCAEAEVYETVTPQRCTRSFFLRRALLRGAAPHFTFRDVAKSLVAIPAYSVALPFLFLFGQHRMMKYLIKDCDHIGRVLSFVGATPVTQYYVSN